MLMRPILLQFISETPRCFAAKSGDRTPRPFTRGPGGIGKKSERVASFTQTASETFKVGLGTTGFGMTAANQTDCQVRIVHPRSHDRVRSLLARIHLQ